jgi:tetratricopeptide (TPR) repeat protein
MKEICITFLTVMVLAPVLIQPDPLFSELVEIGHADDQYTLILPQSVYEKKGSTYELEELTVLMEIYPLDWIGREEGIENKEYFSKIFFSIVVTDSRGGISMDFESYLNCELEDCDSNAMQKRLFWDHAGEERADRAGESFEKETPLVVENEYLEVTVRPSSFFAEWSPFSPYESDVACILLLEGLTVEVTVDYSSMQRALRISLEEASEHVMRGDEYAETGNLDQAQREYGKAKTIYDQVEDSTRSAAVQEKIVELDRSRIMTYLTLAEEYSEQGEHEKAKEQYEKAQSICDQRGDTEQSAEIQEKIDECTSHVGALESLEEGIHLFEEAKTAVYEWRAETKYEKAKSLFEKAKTEFDQLGNTQKSDECTAWISRCDNEREKIGTEGADKDESTSLLVYSVLIIVIAAAGICAGIIMATRNPAKKAEKKAPEESDELKNLKYSLATGEISAEEYEKLKSVLKNE